MKHNIAVVDPSGRVSEALISLTEELESVIHSYSSAGELASDLNKKTVSAEKFGVIVLCMLKSSGKHPENAACLSLAGQIKKHSKYSGIPILFVGPESEEIKESCRDLHELYIPSPLKKRELAVAIKRFCSNDEKNGTEELPDLKMRADKPGVKGRGDNGRFYPATEDGLPEVKRDESERRIATVMFADISGFTAMSEKMDPEEVTRIMNLCFRTLGGCVEHHGGYIDKFIGDCIMIVFGVPKALENAPLQAVNTAIDLRNTIYNFNKTSNLKVPLDIHIGINTGMVLSGVVGSDLKMDYTVMGDTVNLASRLEDASEKGQILVGVETYRATKGRLEYRELKPLTLKGKSEPVSVYEVLSFKEADAGRQVRRWSGRRGTADRIIYSGLVGRSEEMNMLRLLVMKLINGEGGIVNIIGEAGIGKSRLMAELMEDPTMEQVTRLEGKAISIGRNLSYYPVIDLLKKWAGITEEDTQLGSFAKIDRAVRSVHPAEADEIIPFISALMGLTLTGRHAERMKGIEGEALENLIRKNVRELLRRSSEIRPLIVYIEDLHWADGSSLELLESLYNLVENYRIIFINAFRPGYSDTGERIRKKASDEYSANYTEITIEPLEEKESALLISSLLNISGLPHKLEEQIKERSGGNPFFIEEVVRSLIDEGAIALSNGRFTVTERIHNFNIPMTINEVLMARIDRLDDDTRDLVKTASVIGRSFFHKIIVQLAENISDIDKRLNYLEDIQMIRERKRLDELEYLFKHALTQEAAYQSLLMQKRRELHLQVADAIETVFNERLHEFYGMLAYHYSMGEDLDRAEEYMLKAGEEAMKSSASSEALVYFQQALNIYNSRNPGDIDNLKLAELERNIGYAYLNRGLLVESVQSLSSSLKHYGFKETTNIFLIGVKLIYNIAAILFNLYLLPGGKKMKISERETILYKMVLHRGSSLTVIDAKRMFMDSMDAFKNMFKYNPCSSQVVFSGISSGSSLFSTTGISFSIAEKMLGYIKKQIPFLEGDISPFIYFFSKAIYDYLAGEWSDDFEQDSIDYANKTGDTWYASTFLAFQLRMQVALGSFDKGIDTVCKQKKMWDLFNDEYCRSQFYQCSATLSLHKRDLERGLLYVDEGLNHIYKLGQAQITVHYMGLIAMIMIYSGDPDGAERIILKGEELASKEKRFLPHFYIAYINAIYLLNLNRMGNAIKLDDRPALKAYASKAIMLEKKILHLHKTVSFSRTESFKNIGIFYWFTGKHHTALKWLKRSAAEGERLKARPELSRTWFDIAKILITLRDAPPSGIKRKTADRLLLKAAKIFGLTPEQCLEKAESMFREMDLNWDLAKLEEFRENIKLR